MKMTTTMLCFVEPWNTQEKMMGLYPYHRIIRSLPVRHLFIINNRVGTANSPA